jgi:hypothetical protein
MRVNGRGQPRYARSQDKLPLCSENLNSIFFVFIGLTEKDFDKLGIASIISAVVETLAYNQLINIAWLSRLGRVGERKFTQGRTLLVPFPYIDNIQTKA